MPDCPIGFNVMLGGVDETGMDAVNELSYLFLKAQADLGLPQPNLSVRMYAGSDDRFLQAVAPYTTLPVPRLWA